MTQKHILTQTHIYRLTQTNDTQTLTAIAQCCVFFAMHGPLPHALLAAVEQNAQLAADRCGAALTQGALCARCAQGIGLYVAPLPTGVCAYGHRQNGSVSAPFDAALISRYTVALCAIFGTVCVALCARFGTVCVALCAIFGAMCEVTDVFCVLCCVSMCVQRAEDRCVYAGLPHAVQSV